MNRIIRATTIAGVVACSAFAALGVAPAFADSTGPSAPAPTSSSPAPHAHRTLATVQTAGAAATAKRITSLDTAIDRVAANSTLTGSDKTTILATLNADLGGMKTVAARIAADTTLTQAKADYATIFRNYRVYAVGLRQAAYAELADHVTPTIAARLTAEEARLSGRLSGKDAAKSTSALQADLTDMTAQIAKATGTVSGLAAGALAVTPAQFNSNHAVMAPFTASAAAARAALKQARSDAQTVRAALK